MKDLNKKFTAQDFESLKQKAIEFLVSNFDEDDEDEDDKEFAKEFKNSSYHYYKIIERYQFDRLDIQLDSLLDIMLLIEFLSSRNIDYRTMAIQKVNKLLKEFDFIAFQVDESPNETYNNVFDLEGENLKNDLNAGGYVEIFEFGLVSWIN